MSRPNDTWRAVATFSEGLARNTHLAALLGGAELRLRPTDEEAGDLDAVIGWGQKDNNAAARAFAERHRLPFWRAEDGFLRSVGVGAEGELPLSIVLDDLGIYYDARQPSRLEQWLAADGPGDPLADPALLGRARAAIDRITAAGLSKYNNSVAGPVDLGPARRRVLVVDQTLGDLSVTGGLAEAGTFAAMLDAARAENPDAEIIVKVHPDVLAGAKQGYLEHAAGDRVRVVGEPLNPIELVRQVERVYVVTSQLGFEALMLGVPVTCFGVPFYAGWGLTDDRAEVPRRGRNRTRTIEELFAAAYLLYPRYLDPGTGEPGQLEQVIDYLALQRQQFQRNRGRIFCFGFHIWKHNVVRAYLRSPGNQVFFPRHVRQARKLGFGPGDHLLVWGQRHTPEVTELAGEHGVPIWRMEDGFLRSVGLGSNLETPASLVVDRNGIYYDPTGPSELEGILETAAFEPDELTRAAALRQRIVAARLSKYNVGESVRVEVPAGRQVILCPGQVEDDASIELGCRDVRTNLGLLRAAREAAPDAYIIFKPHPDVLMRNRAGSVEASEALALCDHIETGASLADCLEDADEVHTLTSLVGFEALLRGKRVVVHGQPFYAGWGLTTDRHPVARRTRRLSLDELVAGVLLRYPRYLDRKTGRFTTPEVVIAQLEAERDADPAARTVTISWPRRQLRRLMLAYKGVVNAP